METLFIGKNILFLTEVDSTNTYAMNLLRNVNTIEGTLIYTNHQTHGRGQRGAVWKADIASNLTFSVILKPQFLSSEKSFYLSKITALAIYDVLTEILKDSQYDIKIKWPNDILVNQKKIAGILIENTLNQTMLNYSVIGIGLNVNQTEFNTEFKAVSLKALKNIDFERKDVLAKLCQHLEKWYLRLRENKLSIINESYISRLFGLKELLEYTEIKTQRRFKAKIEGVEFSGKLVLRELGTNKLLVFDLKELKFPL